MVYLVCPNELSVFRLAWLAFRRQDIFLLPVGPVFPPARFFLTRLAGWMLKSGRARDAVELCPDLEPITRYGARILLYDIFGQIEEWQNARYRFDEADRAVPDYACAYRHVTCAHTQDMQLTILLVAGAIERLGEPSVQVIGLAEDCLQALRAYCRRRVGPTFVPQRVPNVLINLVTTVAVQVYSLAWVTSRLRRSAPPPERCFLIADYADDPSDVRLYDELADGGPVLLINRPSFPRAEDNPATAKYRSVSILDGAFSFMGWLRMAREIVVDAGRIFRCFRWLHPAHYYRVAAFPHRRAIYRAFFTRFRPRFFWGRDGYNVEHVFKRQEVHRVGGESISVNTGGPSYSIVFPMFRYLSFDRYYVLGRGVLEKHYGDTWPDDMRLIGVGTTRATRRQFERRLDPKPRDIVVFTAVFVGEPEMATFVRGLAKRFPERTVLLQVKNLFADTEAGQAYVAACTDGLPNVRPSRESVYDLLCEARYAFSDPSSVVAEAINFGTCAFAVEIGNLQRTNVYRDFPGLAVASAGEAADRIHALEDGSWRYPRESYGDLIDLSGRYFTDIVREDIGLAADTPARAGSEHDGIARFG